MAQVPVPGVPAPMAQVPVPGVPAPMAQVPVADHQMTGSANGATYEQFVAQGFTDEQMIVQGYMLPPGGMMPGFVS